MTTILTGTFPNANGEPVPFDRMPVEVTRDGQSLHFRVGGSGYGSVAVSGGAGLGSFRTLAGEEFAFSLEPEGGGTRYRILDGDAQIATGMFYDLPP